MRRAIIVLAIAAALPAASPDAFVETVYRSLSGEFDPPHVDGED